MYAGNAQELVRETAVLPSPKRFPAATLSDYSDCGPPIPVGELSEPGVVDCAYVPSPSISYSR